MRACTGMPAALHLLGARSQAKLDQRRTQLSHIDVARAIPVDPREDGLRSTRELGVLLCAERLLSDGMEHAQRLLEGGWKKGEAAELAAATAGRVRGRGRVRWR